MHVPAGFTISPMNDDEVSTLEEWAAAEGWNSGLGDLDCEWAEDPK
jgi:hypothetical protein